MAVYLNYYANTLRFIADYYSTVTLILLQRSWMYVLSHLNRVDKKLS